MPPDSTKQLTKKQKKALAFRERSGKPRSKTSKRDEGILDVPEQENLDDAEAGVEAVDGSAADETGMVVGSGSVAKAKGRGKEKARKDGDVDSGVDGAKSKSKKRKRDAEGEGVEAQAELDGAESKKGQKAGNGDEKRKKKRKKGDGKAEAAGEGEGEGGDETKEGAKDKGKQRFILFVGAFSFYSHLFCLLIRSWCR